VHLFVGFATVAVQHGIGQRFGETYAKVQPVAILAETEFQTTLDQVIYGSLDRSEIVGKLYYKVGRHYSGYELEHECERLVARARLRALNLLTWIAGEKSE
jgi:hypothetical protein